MAKTKTIFVCQSCGSIHNKWMGKCSDCNNWNTIIEEVKTIEKTNYFNQKSTKPTAHKLSDITVSDESRIITQNKEFDRVLGGGIVMGSVILLGGQPGVGKSTLMLQISLSMKSTKTLYVSGEESLRQIKLHSSRLGHNNDNFFVLSETSTQNIFNQIKKIQPDFVVIDSIQTLRTNRIESSAGSVSQIRESANELIEFAKQNSTPIIFIGHITKDGTIAGPKVLEHMVDVVLQFEGDKNYNYRILRSYKNRFGSTSEIGIYSMGNNGLKEISNPSEILITKKDNPVSGNAIAVTMEGSRPILIEVQSLVSTSVYGTPQRSCTGFDTKRLNILLAVLEKKLGFKLSSKDVFLNITGGVKISDISVDLAVVMAITSSDKNFILPDNYCFAAEIGLSGELRPSSNIENRIKEAQKLGFKKIFISKYCKINPSNFDINIVKSNNIEHVLKNLF